MNDLRKNIWKTLKMIKIIVGLTLRLLFCTKPIDKVCPYGTYLLLGSLEHVHRGRNVLFKELRVTNVCVQILQYEL